MFGLFEKDLVSLEREREREREREKEKIPQLTNEF